MRYLCALLAAAVYCTTSAPAVCRGEEPADSDPGRTLLRDSGIPGGICVVVGCSSAEMPLALAQNGGFVVHALFRDEAELRRARETIRTHGSTFLRFGFVVHQG